MKTLTTKFIVILFLITIFNASAQTPIILKEWASYSGISDSVFKNPVLTEGDYSYTASVHTDSLSGPNIQLNKYNQYGAPVWKTVWTGTGYGRDQTSGMAMDDDFLYICGATYTSANNFDYVIIKIRKSGGGIEWVHTFNGAASNYDLATAIVVHDSSVYITGVSFNTATAADYHTIKYDKDGNFQWDTDFDYNNLLDIPFALTYSESDSTLIVTGGSQSNLIDWDYQTIIYDYTGSVFHQNRVSGSAAGFDRAQAVTTDDNGNIYITGGTYESATSYDIKNVKLDKTGNLVWLNHYDSGGDDIANDIIVDTSGNPYICGSVKGNGQEYFVAELNRQDGSIAWYQAIDGNGTDDSARAICFDSRGNIIVTGQAVNPNTNNYDFLTIAYQPDGTELWRDYFDGPNHGDDNATNITADNNGNIFVTGQVATDGGTQTVTIKYRTDYFTEPSAVDTPSTAYEFYPNSGQLVDINDSDITDSVHYYTVHHYPQLYFGYGVMNMVWSEPDGDTATADTLQRVDVSFLNSTNPTEAFPSGVDTSSFLNYFLAHCPEGITNVQGCRSLVYTDVWPDIDVVYSSNNAGLKISFICNPGSSPQEIGLLFNGQSNLTIDQNWYLKVNTLFGDYNFEKPRIYEVDTSNNRIQENWQLSWSIGQSDEALFSGWGSYNTANYFIIEIAQSNISTTSFTGIKHSTYMGGPNEDAANATAVNEYNSVIVGYTENASFPLAAGVSHCSGPYPTDAFISYFDAFTQVMLWGTFYGGTNLDHANDVDFDKIGYVYVIGGTASIDLPQHTNTSLVTITNGGVIAQGSAAPYGTDNFLIKFDKFTGQPIWANYIGSTGMENLHSGAITIDQTGDEAIYIAGITRGTDFPSLGFANSSTDYFQNVNNGNEDGYILRFSKIGTLEWGTYFGSEDYDFIDDIFAVHETGSDLRLYIAGTTNSTGYDANSCLPPPSTLGGFPNCNAVSGSHFSKRSGDEAFIAEFNKDLELIWTSFIGGDGFESMGRHCLTGYSNIVYLGVTCRDATGTPTPPTCTICYNQTSIAGGVNDGYILRFDNETLSWSTFFGGDQGENISALNVFNTDLFVTGSCYSSQVAPLNQYCGVPTSGYFPLCEGPVSGYYFNGNINFGIDAYVAMFNSNNHLDWSTLIGGHFSDFAYDIKNDNNFIYLVGATNSYNITSTNEDYPQQILGSATLNQGQNAGPGLNGGLGPSYGFSTIFYNGTWIPVTEIKNVKSSISLSPNPTTEKIKINILNNRNSKFNYSIFNEFGQLVIKDKFSKEQIEVNISNLTAGIYLLTIYSDDFSKSQKFIKQ